MVTSTIVGLEDVLRAAAQAAQLPPTDHEAAREKYDELGRNLLRGTLAKFSPSVYPQGSIAIGTTVRPPGREDFDLDAVLELHGSRASEGAKNFVDFVTSEVERCAPSDAQIEQRPRCVRLGFGRFHVDVVPARPNDSRPPSIWIPTSEPVWQFEPSNPLGYIEWFETQQAIVTTGGLKASLEPAPPPQPSVQKSILQVTVQLLKRHHQREVDESLRSASILLTTLVAQSYSGQSTIVSAMGAAVAALAVIAGSEVASIVENPSNPGENLARKWNDPAVYGAFRRWVGTLQTHWAMLQMGDDARPAMNIAFGERVTREAYRQIGETITEARTSGFVTTSAAGMLGLDARRRPNPDHVFHGQAE